MNYQSITINSNYLKKELVQLNELLNQYNATLPTLKRANAEEKTEIQNSKDEQKQMTNGLKICKASR